MWSKSFAAIVGGALLSASLGINLYLLLPLATDSRLLLGLMLAFPLWVGVMVWCYTSQNGWQAWRRCAAGLLVSGGVNALSMI